MAVKGLTKSVVLRGPRLTLRDVNLSDVGEHYVSWMNDGQVNQFLESRFVSHTIASLSDFVKGITADERTVFLAMLLTDSGRHIGNIKLGPIDCHHRLGDIGVVIGEKDCWGQKLAPEAIGLLVGYAFGTLGLHKVTAGCYEPNRGSSRAFEKVGFVVEGCRKAHRYYRDEFVDVFELGLLNPDFRSLANEESTRKPSQ